MTLKIRDKKQNKLIVTIDDEGQLTKPEPEKDNKNDNVRRLGENDRNPTIPTKKD